MVFIMTFARDEPFSDSDLEQRLKKKCMRLLDQDPKTTREVWDRNKAIQAF